MWRVFYDRVIVPWLRYGVLLPVVTPRTPSTISQVLSSWKNPSQPGLSLHSEAHSIRLNVSLNTMNESAAMSLSSSLENVSVKFRGRTLDMQVEMIKRIICEFIFNFYSILYVSYIRFCLPWVTQVIHPCDAEEKLIRTTKTNESKQAVNHQSKQSFIFLWFFDKKKLSQKKAINYRFKR